MQLTLRLAQSGIAMLVVGIASLALGAASYAEGTDTPLPISAELRHPYAQQSQDFAPLRAGLDKAAEDIEEGAEATVDATKDAADHVEEGA